MSDDARGAERLDLPASLRGEIQVFQKVDIRQLSVDGALIETAFPLRVDAVHDFRLSLGDAPLIVKARVAHSSIAGVEEDAVVYHSGLEFVELSPPVARAIGVYIQRRK